MRDNVRGGLWAGILSEVVPNQVSGLIMLKVFIPLISYNTVSA